jgi:hypothetical protein
MIVKKYGEDFDSSGGALTLDPDCVFEEGLGKSYPVRKLSSRTHENGWTIKGTIIEDYYYWVNDFEAQHPKFGRVWGDFEDKVFADSEEGFEDFYKNFPPNAWDYADI